MVLKCENELMFLRLGGSEFQSRGAEQLKALLPIVVRRAEGTVKGIKEDDLRVRERVAT